MIDDLSRELIAAALYLDAKIPGSVSEIWIGETEKNEIQQSLPNETEIQDRIDELKQKLIQSESRRNQYLLSVLNSLEFQIVNQDSWNGYADFSEATFGYRIERITHQELTRIDRKLTQLEEKMGMSRFEIFKKNEIDKDQYSKVFEEKVAKAKEKLPSYLFDFPDTGFIFETTTNKPWTAFNTHFETFASKLTLNLDIDFTAVDFERLAYHEAYGGHHAELSNKDKLLIDEGRGEHGMIITFSPQTFISEAIAEGVFVFLGGLDKENDEQMIGWNYDRLVFGSYNLASHMCFDDGKSKQNVAEALSKYGLSQKSIDEILNFSFDPVFGKYAPVYYSAYNFLEKLFNQIDEYEKEDLIKTLFFRPCTVDLLEVDFLMKREELEN